MTTPRSSLDDDQVKQALVSANKQFLPLIQLSEEVRALAKSKSTKAIMPPKR